MSLSRWFYIPEAASAHGPQLDQLNDLMHWVMLLLFIGWGAFFLFAIFRFRQSANPRADYTGVKSHSSTYLEVGVAIAEAVLLVGFSIPLWADRVDEAPPEGEAVVVRVVAEQFVWNFHYPGADGVFGKTDIHLIDLESNPLGLDRDDPLGADDITTRNQLHLPVNKPAILHITSKDVIHSFNMPHMRVKQDTIPGMSIPIWFEPTVTTAKMRERTGNDEFVYEIACAQLCGLGHSSMRGFYTIHEEEEFDAWLAEEAELLQGGDDFWD